MIMGGGRGGGGVGGVVGVGLKNKQQQDSDGEMAQRIVEELKYGEEDASAL